MNKFTTHEFDWEKTKILDKGDSWFELGIKEAIHIYSNTPP